MIIFFAVALAALITLFSLSCFDSEERTDLTCDCVPFELLSSTVPASFVPCAAEQDPASGTVFYVPAALSKKKVPIERFYYDPKGDLIFFGPDGSFSRSPSGLAG